ncbi:TatD family hydrolase [Bacillus sp. C11]|nr:TatD family hydrolase [Neobacillus terrae]
MKSLVRFIDSHIHLDKYDESDIRKIIENLPLLKGLITVSSDLDSCRKNKSLSERYPKIKPAYGYHPEQVLPTDQQTEELLNWMYLNLDNMVAVGEVGLPYYLKKDNKITLKEYDQHLEFLNMMMQKAKSWDKAIILHAVHEDADVVCDMLEKHSIKKAHFHWFKGDKKTTERMAGNGYYISVTPDIVYKERTQNLVRAYPLEQVMVETDGPWPFEGPFQCQKTLPGMILYSLKAISELQGYPEDELAGILLSNTKQFYSL